MSIATFFLWRVSHYGVWEFLYLFSPTFQCGFFKRKRGIKRGYNIDEEQEEAEGEGGGGGGIGEEGDGEEKGEETGEGEGGEEYDYITRNDVIITTARNEAYGVTGDVSLTSNIAYGLVA